MRIISKLTALAVCVGLIFAGCGSNSDLGGLLGTEFELTNGCPEDDADENLGYLELIPEETAVSGNQVVVKAVPKDDAHTIDTIWVVNADDPDADDPDAESPDDEDADTEPLEAELFEDTTIFTFEMPAYNAKVKAHFRPLTADEIASGSGSGDMPEHTVTNDREETAKETNHGWIVINTVNDKMEVGGMVVFYPKPIDTYKYKAGSAKVTGDDGKEIDTTHIDHLESTDACFFVMPDQDVKVTCEFEKVQQSSP